MEIRFSAELEEKLDCLASRLGRTREAIVAEAVERFMDHENWLLREIEKGIAAADRGELVDHEEIKKLIDRRYQY
jgi:predicted transcriptional regulator